MFCKNCGKEIGNSAFCQYCGCGQGAYAVSYGEVVPTITEDGRRIYRNSDEAFKAFKKVSGIQTLANVFSYIGTATMTIGALALLGSVVGLMASREFEPSYGIVIFLSIVTFLMFDLTSFLSIPRGIFIIVSTRKLSTWVKENNVDCIETTKDDKGKYAASFKIAHLLNEDPKSKTLQLVSGIINVILLPIAYWMMGLIFFIGNIGMLSLGEYFLTIEYSFLTEIGLWSVVYIFFVGLGAVLILFLASLPSIIMEAVLKKRAKKNFDK